MSIASGHDLKSCVSTPVRETYEPVRAATELLARPLSAEDCCIQSMPEASPTKWHLAHTTWFFDQFVLKQFQPEYQPVEPCAGALFNSYYNSAGPQHCRARRGVLSRPSIDWVYQYRRHVDKRVLDLLNSDTWADNKELEDWVTLGLNHEQQHQELMLTDIKHALSCNPTLPQYCPGTPQIKRTAQAPAKTPTLRWEKVGSGLWEIGAEDDEPFAFDNERPRHRVYLNSYRIASRLVTNGEYLRFIQDGGYDRPELWLALGWDHIKAHGWAMPLYWFRGGDQSDRWFQYTLYGSRELDMAEPVCHVSYFEADAYARWAGSRLPTEAEWEVGAMRHKSAGFFPELCRLHPAPPDDQQAIEPAHYHGELWQWTASPFSAYPGYTIPDGAYGEYNSKFMCNQFVLRGGSCATPRSHYRPTYRNFFPPEARWQFSGIRLAQDYRLKQDHSQNL